MGIKDTAPKKYNKETNNSSVFFNIILSFLDRSITVLYLFQSLEKQYFSDEIPSALIPINFEDNILVKLIDINVKFENKTVLNKINWTIKKGEFWQLIGANGSGKTTLLSMITGENTKGYNQELYLFSFLLKY